MSDDGDSTAALRSLGDSLDMATFEQLLDMDEEDDRDFTRGIVFGYFEQVEQTFDTMDDNIRRKDLSSLSDLGHFLKGSSATLGLNHLRNSCEKIQHWGHCKDETGAVAEESSICLKYIEAEMKQMRSEYARIKTALQKFYGEA